ncbi:MAG: A24 family peptidase [Candidatus Woesearchaeota archaeon]
MHQEILYTLAFLVLLVSSYTDLRKREVPDSVSYGLIFAVMGLRGIFALSSQDVSIFVEGLLGLGLMYLFACLMYYSGQWGGGDAKIIMGLGAVFGLSPIMSFQTLFMFLINMVMFGAVYGVVWTIYLILKNWTKCVHELHILILSKKVILAKYFVYISSILLLVSGAFFMQFRLLFFTLAIFTLGMFYLWICTKVVENAAMLKKTLPSQLTEGDWIAEDVVVDGKRICGSADLGVSKKQIKELAELYSRGKIKHVVVKEGVPFVPSFLIAFIATLLLDNWILLFL